MADNEPITKSPTVEEAPLAEEELQDPDQKVEEHHTQLGCGVFGRYPIISLLSFVAIGVAVGVGLSYWQPTDPSSKETTLQWLGLLGDLFLRYVDCLLAGVNGDCSFLLIPYDWYTTVTYVRTSAATATATKTPMILLSLGAWHPPPPRCVHRFNITVGECMFYVLTHPFICLFNSSFPPTLFEKQSIEGHCPSHCFCQCLACGCGHDASWCCWWRWW